MLAGHFVVFVFGPTDRLCEAQGDRRNPGKTMEIMGVVHSVHIKVIGMLTVVMLIVMGIGDLTALAQSDSVVVIDDVESHLQAVDAELVAACRHRRREYESLELTYEIWKGDKRTLTVYSSDWYTVLKKKVIDVKP